MGVTIHFEGKLKSEIDFEKVISLSKNFAEENEMPFSLFEEPNKFIKRVRDEEDWDYYGLAKGIYIQPHENSDPLNLEFDNENYIQEYCKTQFSDIKTHIKIINLLRQIEPFFEDFTVNDEGGYWSLNDKQLLEENINHCFCAIERAKDNNKKLSGPYRIQGRIIDLMD